MATTSAPNAKEPQRLYPDQVENLIFLSGLHHRKQQLLNQIKEIQQVHPQNEAPLHCAHL